MKAEELKIIEIATRHLSKWQSLMREIDDDRALKDGQRKRPLANAIIDAITEATSAQQQEIEGLEQRLESKTNLCLEFETELFRIREGVGKLEPIYDPQQQRYLLIKSDLDNLIGEKK
jgi:hypothetical protein